MNINMMQPCMMVEENCLESAMNDQQRAHGTTHRLENLKNENMGLFHDKNSESC